VLFLISEYKKSSDLGLLEVVEKKYVEKTIDSIMSTYETSSMPYNSTKIQNDFFVENSDYVAITYFLCNKYRKITPSWFGFTYKNNIDLAIILNGIFEKNSFSMQVYNVVYWKNLLIAFDSAASDFYFFSYASTRFFIKNSLISPVASQYWPIYLSGNNLLEKFFIAYTPLFYYLPFSIGISAYEIKIEEGSNIKKRKKGSHSIKNNNFQTHIIPCVKFTLDFIFKKFNDFWGHIVNIYSTFIIPLHKLYAKIPITFKVCFEIFHCIKLSFVRCLTQGEGEYTMEHFYLTFFIDLMMVLFMLFPPGEIQNTIYDLFQILNNFFQLFLVLKNKFQKNIIVFIFVLNLIICQIYIEFFNFNKVKVSLLCLSDVTYSSLMNFIRSCKNILFQTL